MSYLATIQKIIDISSHTNADTLELATVLGWQVVVKKGQFKKDDLVVYVVIDTILPEHPEFEFLRNKKYKIKPICLRGEESAGICFPLNIINKLNKNIPLESLVEGFDVTDIIGVIKYEKPIPTQLVGSVYGSFPGFLVKTDEDNIRTYPQMLNELIGKDYYITRKDDGSSGTYYIHENEFGVCSRNLRLKDTEENGFWRMSRKYDIENNLRNLFPNQSICIQGEVVGPGVQKNQMGLKELEFHVFNLFDIVSRRNLDFDELVTFCNKSSIPMVKIIETGDSFNYDIKQLVELASKQKYDNNNPAEGIVIRSKIGFKTQISRYNKYWSGKIINPLYKED